MIPRYALPGAHSVSRLVKGGWHLSGDHGPIDAGQAVEDMAAFVEAGIDTFDCADIYTNAEDLIGRFRVRFPELARRLRVHTKYVPNLSDLARLDAAAVQRTVDRSLRRLGLERLDLVQLHWWDFDVAGHVEAAGELQRLQQAGKIAHVAVTNYDAVHLRELLGAGIRPAAHQLQYSLLDLRPQREMLALCQEHGIPFLCYGTVAGGFLSDRWLGRPAPEAISNRSLVKYSLVVEDFGGWELLQRLLRALRAVADRHGCDIASVATRIVLDRANVAACIVGAINTHHLAAHAEVGRLRLQPRDLAEVYAVLAEGRALEGDVYELERDRHGRHGRIMKYELQ